MSGVAASSPPDRPERTRRLEPLRPNAHEASEVRTTWDSKRAVQAAAQGDLSGDLLEQGAARLTWIYALSSLTFAAMSVVSFFLERSRATSGTPTLGLELGALGLSAVLWGVNRFAGLRPSSARDLGNFFLILLCLLLSFMRYRGAGPDLEFFAHVSPVVIPILGFAALIPASPKGALSVSLTAAAMDPLALAILYNGGLRAAPAAIALSITSPLFAAFVAHHVSRVVHRLSQGIERAREIGSYELVERLGKGGMAEVWRAEHRMLARAAAVKLIRPEILLGHGPEASERLVQLFLREARTTAQMSSPNTIQIYDFGVTREGAFYYVMELLDGVDLQVLVEKFGAQSPERTAHLLRQICRSLTEAHEHDFVHRDVKPANVFACLHGGEADFVKVLDFGLVLDRHPTVEELSDEQKFVGTPAIMAPEMVRFQAPVDARADLYAVGCVGYWLLTAQRVFQAETRQDMLVMHAHQKPIPPSKRIGRPLHAGLEELIMQCLEKNPDKRPQSARELGEALDALRFEPPWNEERAQLWWRRHKPTEVAREARQETSEASPLDRAEPPVPPQTEARPEPQQKPEEAATSAPPRVSHDAPF